MKTSVEQNYINRIVPEIGSLKKTATVWFSYGYYSSKMLLEKNDHEAKSKNIFSTLGIEHR